MPKKITTKEFIERAEKVHIDKYDYSKVNYIGAQKKIIIICKKHEEFLQRSDIHYSGQGCPDCSGNKKTTTQEFVDKAQKIHNNKYDYSKTYYKNNNTKIIIICKLHGEFSQIPRNHLGGSGCKKCADKNKSLNNNIFIKKVNKIHNNKYNYSKVKYINNRAKIIIICPKHGKFKQSPNKHLLGHGCQKCGSTSLRISKRSQIWLDKIEKENNIKIEREKIIWISNKYFFIDGFDPKTNTCYEYYGNFWHGNPKFYKSSDTNPRTKTTFGELYQRTLEKEKLIKEAGYNLITKWGK